MTPQTISWAGAIGTVVFGLLGVYFFIKSRRFKALALSYRISTLQKKVHPEISIRFRGEEIGNLAKLRVVCWNRGKEEIRASDIPTKGAARIVMGKPVRIFSQSVLARSPEESAFTVAEDSPNSLACSFEYLNPSDWAAMEVLFEGPDDGKPSIDFLGQVIGGRTTKAFAWSKPSSMDTFVVTLFLSFCFFLLGVYAGRDFFVRKHSLWGGLVIGSVYPALFIPLLWQSIVQRFQRPPRAAEKYLEG